MAASSKAKSFYIKSGKVRGFLLLAGIFLALCLSLPGLVVAHAAPTQVSSPPKIAVRAGFDGYYKLNSWLPVKVDISLAVGNASFEGWIEASFTNFGDGSPIYRRAVQLTPPADREIWLYLPSGNQSLQSVQVRLVSQETTVITSQDISIHPLDQSDLLVGVISDDPNSLAILNGLRPTQAYNKGSLFYAIDYYSRSPRPGIVPAIKIIHILPPDLPPDVSGWDSLDGLVLTGLSNTIPLDRLQNAATYQSAAAAWLVQGRFLFIGGDSGLTRSGYLGDFLPVQAAGAPQNKALPDQLRRLQTESTTLPQFLIADTGLLPGASTQLTLDGKPFLAEKPFGLGRSWFSAAELNALPPSILGGLWEIAFQDYEPHLSYTTGLRRPTDLSPPWTSRLSPNTRVATLPNPDVIGLALGIYVLLLGPTSYLVLKMFGKREMGWLVAPVLAIIFSAGFYVAGAITSGEPLVISRVSIVMLGETAQGKMVGGSTNLGTLYSNARNSVEIQVNDQTQAVSLPNSKNSFDLAVPVPNSDFATIRQGPSGGFGPVYLGQDDQRSFALESITPQEVGEGIVANLSAKGTEITGTLENRSLTDWVNLSIWSSGNIIYQVPLIKASEKITLQKSYMLENRTDSLVLVLAGLVDGNAGTSNSALGIGSPAYQSQEVSILNTLMGSEGQVLPKGLARVYLIGWSQATFKFPLKIEGQGAKSKDLTLLFEPLALS
ncbi:MAG: hypothetical protein BGO39_15735 [Chloroflexi bacterium 54-19]|nr:MAG: hypothetical protein BGO39_15735 [Chloroflexi bacterium 54-19]